LEKFIEEEKRKKEKGEESDEKIVFVEMALVRIKAARLKEYAKLQQE